MLIKVTAINRQIKVVNLPDDVAVEEVSLAGLALLVVPEELLGDDGDGVLVEVDLPLRDAVLEPVGRELVSVNFLLGLLELGLQLLDVLLLLLILGLHGIPVEGRGTLLVNLLAHVFLGPAPFRAWLE